MLIKPKFSSIILEEMLKILGPLWSDEQKKVGKIYSLIGATNIIKFKICIFCPGKQNNPRRPSLTYIYRNAIS